MSTSTNRQPNKSRGKFVASGKPGRSASRSRRGLHSAGARRRAQQGQSFDPKELTRRLDAYLLEQSLKANQRRGRLVVQQPKDPSASSRTDLGRTIDADSNDNDLKGSRKGETAPGSFDKDEKFPGELKDVPSREHASSYNPDWHDQGTGSDRQLCQETHVENIEQNNSYSHKIDGASRVDIAKAAVTQPRSPRRSAHPRRTQKLTITYHIRHRSKKRAPQHVYDRQDWAQRDEAVTDSSKTFKEWVNPLLKMKSTIRFSNLRRETMPNSCTEHITEEGGTNIVHNFLSRLRRRSK